MYRFILFITKVYVLLLFIVLEVVALHFYANSTSYTRAKLLSMSNDVVGSLYELSSGVNSYFNLSSENEKLILEIADLRNELERNRLMVLSSDTSHVVRDSIEYFYTDAKIINNTTSRQQNYIIIDKGLRDGIESNMAIVSESGFMVGYVVNSSDKFSSAISIINTKFKGSGRIGSTDWYGSLQWRGVDNNYITLSDIPKYAKINRGDTVYTTNYSAIFPAGVMIGSVESFELTEALLYDVKVKLFAQMGSLNRVLLIKYHDAKERELLEDKFKNI